MAKTLSVAAIKEGTVIDHIPSGAAIAILNLLKLLTDDVRMTVGLNLSSASMGMKDLIKLENKFLTEKEARDIAVFAPNATFNRIRNYKLVSKEKAQLPSSVEGIFVCPNLRCITNHERAITLFSVQEHKTAVLLKCCFCEKIFERHQIKDYCV